MKCPKVNCIEERPLRLIATDTRFDGMTQQDIACRLFKCPGCLRLLWYIRLTFHIPVKSEENWNKALDEYWECRWDCKPVRLAAA